MSDPEPTRDDTTLQRRRALRRNSTRAERLLWGALRTKRLAGLKFRRQHSIGPFIVDLFCKEKMLVIELDGGYHDYVQEKDQQRQQYLEKQGFIVMRFANEDVLDDTEAVVIAIAKRLGVPPLPSPLPQTVADKIE